MAGRTSQAGGGRKGGARSGVPGGPAPKPRCAGKGRGEGAPGRPRGRRGASAGDILAGRHEVEEALAAGVPLRSALVAEGPGADAALEALAARLADAGVPVEHVPRQWLDELCGRVAHQGVAVRVRPYEYATLADVVRAAGEGDALVLVLDHVSDQGNLGAIVRTAEVVGAAGVVVANARAAGVGTGAYKASAGAVLHLPVAQVPNLARALDELKEAGFWACAASEHAENDVWHAPVEGRLALVVGSEGAGVSRLLLSRCDFSCRLPQRGVTESLNVAQAATALCYEWLRRETLRAGGGAAEGGGVA